MRKALCCLLMIGLAISLVITGCAKAPTPTPAPTPAPFEPITIKLATHYQSTGPVSESIQWFAEEVAKRSGNKVKIEFYFAQSLLKSQEILEGVQAGTAEMGIVPQGFYEAQLPLNCISNPVFGKPDLSTLIRARHQLGEEFPVFEKEYQQWGQKPLLYAGGDTYHMTARKPFRTLDDFKGAKVRTWGKYVPKWWSAAGAVPVSMTASEVYDGIGKGIVDIAPGSYEIVSRWKWHEAAPYFTEVDSGAELFVTLSIKLDIWNSLPSDVQQVMLETAQEHGAYYTSLSDQQTAASKNNLVDAGVEIIEFPAADRDRWKQLDEVKECREAWIETAESKGYPGRDIMSRYLELIGY
ncbi:C4-dicarboxylate TRAP transporter substrate-binding protein [Chloroflexota bacterium]